MACLIERAHAFAGSKIALIDLDEERVQLIRRLSEAMAAHSGADLEFTATTDRRAGLADADAVLTSFRPGGFEGRRNDERIPLRHGVIGQETQGPGGLFMAFRSVHALRGMLEDIEVVCPGTRLFNYTNPVNIVSQAIWQQTPVPVVSFCEGPIVYPRALVDAVGLDPSKLDVICVGVNHASWSVVHRYDGEDAVERVRTEFKSRAWNGELTVETQRLLQLLDLMGSFPSSYFQYYFYEREVARELAGRPTTRAEDILAEVPGYWKHYAEQAASVAPILDPTRSRGGINELELAIDAIDAVFNDRGIVLPVNAPNAGSLPGFPDDLVVEVLGRCDRQGISVLPAPAQLPPHLAGIVETLAEYQLAAADAAWSGTRRDGLRALAMHPFVRSVDVAEQLYDELATAHRAFLPERLLR